MRRGCQRRAPRCSRRRARRRFQRVCRCRNRDCGTRRPAPTSTVQLPAETSQWTNFSSADTSTRRTCPPRWRSCWGSTRLCRRLEQKAPTYRAVHRASQTRTNGAAAKTSPRYSWAWWTRWTGCPTRPCWRWSNSWSSSSIDSWKWLKLLTNYQ